MTHMTRYDKPKQQQKAKKYQNTVLQRNLIFSATPGPVPASLMLVPHFSIKNFLKGHFLQPLKNPVSRFFWTEHFEFKCTFFVIRALETYLFKLYSRLFKRKIQLHISNSGILFCDKIQKQTDRRRVDLLFLSSNMQANHFAAKASSLEWTFLSSLNFHKIS